MAEANYKQLVYICWLARLRADSSTFILCIYSQGVEAALPELLPPESSCENKMCAYSIMSLLFQETVVKFHTVFMSLRGEGGLSTKLKQL